MATKAIPPPYYITADDKRGLIVVTVALALAFVWTCSLIRVWLRWKSRDWKADDWLLASATLLHTIQSGIIINLANFGLGASLDGLPVSQLEQLGKHGIASQILYIGTLFLSKCSVLFLYLRLSSSGAHVAVTYGVIATSFAWAIIAVILIVVPCNPAQFYTNPEQCTNRWPKWQAISSIDIATEALIFGIAIQLVWGLQMRLKSKVIVVFAFSARLPVIAVAAVRLYFLHLRFLGTSFLFEYIIATQWQMGYAIMSSTITGMGPFLRPFTEDYTKSYHKTSKYGHSSERSRLPSQSRDIETVDQPQRNSWQSEGYLMQTIPSRGSRTSLPDTGLSNVGNSPPRAHNHSTSTSTTLEPQRSSPSSQAPIMLTADANFRPIDHVSRNDTEIWVGDRAGSFGTEDDMPTTLRDGRGWVINKRTQFKIEVDRASRVV